MGFWDFLAGPTPEQKQLQEQRRLQARETREAELKRQQQDLVALASGGIPVQARARLQELGAHADQQGVLFTSNLAPDELALLRRHGYRPRGLVTGSAMYHVGTIYVSSFGDSEAPAFSQAYDQATALAVSRLQQEAAAIGAHGVVGVRLSFVRHEWSEKCIEVQLVGTAIEGPAAPRQPWISDLSGQEWFALHRAGYEPAGLVWGHAAWFIYTTATDEMVTSVFGTGFRNQEMEHWSQALSTARHIAMNHIHRQIAELSAAGIMGVKVERRLDRVHLRASSEAARERVHHNLVVSIVGTALRPAAGRPAPVPATVPLLSLRDGRIRPAAVIDPALAVED